MELLSNSLAAYAHIRGEGQAWEDGTRPSLPRQPSTYSCSLSALSLAVCPPLPFSLQFLSPSLDPGSLPDGMTPACQAPL